MSALVVVGEHELGLWVAKLGALEFAVHVAYLYAHALTVQSGVPALLALRVAQGPAIVAREAVGDGSSVLLGRHGALGIGASGLPVVDAGAPLPASSGGALLHHDHRGAGSRRADGRVTAGDAAAQDEHVRGGPGLFAVAHGIGPLRDRVSLVHEVPPRGHKLVTPTSEAQGRRAGSPGSLMRCHTGFQHGVATGAMQALESGLEEAKRRGLVDREIPTAKSRPWSCSSRSRQSTKALKRDSATSSTAKGQLYFTRGSSQV